MCGEKKEKEKRSYKLKTYSEVCLFVSREMIQCLEFALKYSRKQNETKCVEVSCGEGADEISSAKCWKLVKLDDIYMQFIKLFSLILCMFGNFHSSKKYCSWVFNYLVDNTYNHVAGLLTSYISPKCYCVLFDYVTFPLP